MGTSGQGGGCEQNDITQRQEKKIVYDGSHDGDIVGVENETGCDLKIENEVCSGDGSKKSLVDEWLSKRMDNVSNKECQGTLLVDNDRDGGQLLIGTHT